jgi:hypothetical protein
LAVGFLMVAKEPHKKTNTPEMKKPMQNAWAEAIKQK